MYNIYNSFFSGSLSIKKNSIHAAESLRKSERVSILHLFMEHASDVNSLQLISKHYTIKYKGASIVQKLNNF